MRHIVVLSIALVVSLLIIVGCASEPEVREVEKIVKSEDLLR